MIERFLLYVGSLLPAYLQPKPSIQYDADEEAGTEACSDLLAASQQRVTAKDGRRDVRPTE